MSKRTTTIAMVLLMGVIIAFFATRTTGQRICGHKRYLVGELLPWRATHDCGASFTVNALLQLYGAQELFHHERGYFATSLSQLTNGFSSTFLDVPIELRATSNDWSCLVPRSGHLPGSYLLCSDGRLYFSQRANPTTNSTLLRDSKTGFSIGL